MALRMVGTMPDQALFIVQGHVLGLGNTEITSSTVPVSPVVEEATPNQHNVLIIQPLLGQDLIIAPIIASGNTLRSITGIKEDFIIKRG